MTVENKTGSDIVFLSKREMGDERLIEIFQELRCEVKERPPHPLVRALQRIMLKCFNARAPRS